MWNMKREMRATINIHLDSRSKFSKFLRSIFKETFKQRSEYIYIQFTNKHDIFRIFDVKYILIESAFFLSFYEFFRR